MSWSWSVKAGDLVQMKYDMWWKMRSRKEYTKEIGVVLERHHNAVKVLLPEGKIKSSLAEHWKVINKST